MKLAVSLFVLLFTCFISLHSEVNYKTNKLWRISEAINLDWPDSLLDKDIDSVIIFHNRPIIVRVRGKRIEHIGYCLLTLQQREHIKSPAIDFLERYFLELDLPIDTIWVPSQRMRIDKVAFEIGDKDFLKELPNDSNYAIHIETNERFNYVVCWIKDNSIRCKLRFPMHYDLICGQDKRELMIRLRQEIERDTLHIQTECNIRPEMLIKDSLEMYYVLKGGYYYSKDFYSDQYFVLDSTFTPKPYYEPLHIVETISNLFSMPYFRNEYDLDITIKYAKESVDMFSIPLSKWTQFCSNQGCCSFFGILSFEDPLIANCLIIYYNDELAYKHSMEVRFDLDSLYTLKGHIQAILRCYQMTSKIDNLFKELNI